MKLKEIRGSEIKRACDIVDIEHHYYHRLSHGAIVSPVESICVENMATKESYIVGIHCKIDPYDGLIRFQLGMVDFPLKVSITYDYVSDGSMDVDGCSSHEPPNRFFCKECGENKSFYVYTKDFKETFGCLCNIDLEKIIAEELRCRACQGVIKFTPDETDPNWGYYVIDKVYILGGIAIKRFSPYHKKCGPHKDFKEEADSEQRKQ